MSENAVKSCSGSPLKANPIPVNEEKRLQTIKDLNVLQHFRNDESLNRITNVAAEYFHCPMALITIVGEKTVWFLADRGLELSEVVRNVTLCQYTILPETGDVLVIPDAAVDPRSKDLENFKFYGIRFYAASSIHLNDLKIGTICIMDTKLRPDFDAEKMKRLLDLGNTVSDIIFAKRHTEFEQEPNLVLDIVISVCKEILNALHVMVQSRNELVQSSKHPNSNKEKIQRAENDLNAKRADIRKILENGLVSVNNLKRLFGHKKEGSSAHPLCPHYTFTCGDYSEVKEWFTKLKEKVLKDLPNYSKYVHRIKFGFHKIRKLKDYEANEGNIPFLSTIITLLAINALQKWKQLRISFTLIPSDAEADHKPTSIVPEKSTETGEPTETQIQFDLERGKSTQFHFLSGKLTIEMKGTQVLKRGSGSSWNPFTSSSGEEYPLFQDESQFCAICDNFIASTFQMVEGEFRHFSSPNEEVQEFWLPSHLKDDIRFSGSRPVSSSSHSHWGLSVNNLFRGEWGLSFTTSRSVSESYKSDYVSSLKEGGTVAFPVDLPTTTHDHDPPMETGVRISDPQKEDESSGGDADDEGEEEITNNLNATSIALDEVEDVEDDPPSDSVHDEDWPAAGEQTKRIN